MKNFLIVVPIIFLSLFSRCSHTTHEQTMEQLRISNEIIYAHLEEKRSGFVSFMAEYPRAIQYVRRAEHLIELYDHDPNKFHNPTKYDSSIDWLRTMIHKDSLWKPDPRFELPDSTTLAGMSLPLKQNIVLTHYAKLFKDAGNIGLADIKCDFGLFTGFQLDSTNIIGLKTNMPLTGNNYTLTINEPNAEVWPIKMLGLIHVPKNSRKKYEVVIRTEDPMYKNPISDTVTVKMVIAK